MLVFAGTVTYERYSILSKVEDDAAALFYASCPLFNVTASHQNKLWKCPFTLPPCEMASR